MLTGSPPAAPALMTSDIGLLCNATKLMVLPYAKSFCNVASMDIMVSLPIHCHLAVPIEIAEQMGPKLMSPSRPVFC